MRKRSLIQAVSDGDSSSTDEILLTEEVVEETSDDIYEATEVWEEEKETPSRQWIAPTVAIVAIAAWTAFYVWANSAAMFAGATAQEWSGWITSWAIPVLLVVSLWLLAMRNSTREAQRYGEVALSLREESARLEERLVTVNRELSLAREFLTSQTRDLEYLGRSASERISENADRLQGLIRHNGEQVDAIAKVSETALENMDRLRDNLPVLANSAKDVSNQIGSAGRTAKSQVDELIEGFKRLNDFGAASERQVTSLRTRVDEALEAFTDQTEQLGTVADARFATLREQSEVFRADLDSREVDALASIRARADALRAELESARVAADAEHEAALATLRERIQSLQLESTRISIGVRDGEKAAIEAWGSQVDAMAHRLREAIEEIRKIDESALVAANAKLKALFEEATAVDERITERNRAFDEQNAKRRVELEEAEQAAIAAMRSRLETLDAALEDRQRSHSESAQALVREGENLTARLAELGTSFAKAESQGREASGAIAESVDALNAKLSESREALDGTDMAVAALTDASVRLLELIQASAKQGREILPEAMASSEQRLTAIETRARDIKALLETAGAAGSDAAASMELTDQRARSAIAEIEAFQSRFAETATAQIGSIERLRDSVSALGSENEAVAERAKNELRAAIEQLESSARDAIAAIETEQGDRLAKIADRVGEQSAQAIDRALAEHTEQALGKIDEATARSTNAGRETIRMMRDQLAKVNELTGNLESRIAQARERASEEVGNDFSRRVALITESLNSNAIDIAKALSTEVTDTAWASYLRGDRGIFTRRAVRLLDNTEAREIAELYDTDHDFREHVSRYIHDFESMLRTMLSTRDGHALSVTLLSSDMGKLYVAMAQALERLRQ
ncbi:ATPase [Qipengyuania sp. RANM35]|uniref:ATPase n=1 Tax=Qipengyuania sp. RANM35 TaxID=3068635 RepID=UPI0034DB604A